MDIQLGKPVLSCDGIYLGKVDRVVLEPATREVVEIIVHRGFLFTTDRLIELPLIDRIADDGIVYLTVTAMRASELPLFYEHEYVVPTPDELRTEPFPVAGGVSGGGASTMPLVWRTTWSGRDFHPASRSLFEPAAINVQAIEKRSNLPDNTVVLSRSTDIICGDGQRCGVVADVIYDEHGELEAVVGAFGFRHKRHVRVPAAQIASMTHDHVRLTVDSEQLMETEIEEDALATAR